jgi:ADP-glucose pyrophosphorylase
VTIAASGDRDLGVYVFSTGVLFEALKDNLDRRSGCDLGRDIWPALAGGVRVHTCDFPGYWREIQTLDDYYNANMDLVQPEPLFKPFDGNACGKASVFSGARVSRSVLSFGVCIGQHAWVENSVILPGAHVGKGARIRRAIVEEGVQIPEGYRVGWDAAEDAKQHTITSSGIVVVSHSPGWSRNINLRGPQSRFLIQQSALADRQSGTSFCNILINGIPKKIDKDSAQGCSRLPIGDC